MLPAALAPPAWLVVLLYPFIAAAWGQWNRENVHQESTSPHTESEQREKASLRLAFLVTRLWCSLASAPPTDGAASTRDYWATALPDLLIAVRDHIKLHPDLQQELLENRTATVKVRRCERTHERHRLHGWLLVPLLCSKALL